MYQLLTMNTSMEDHVQLETYQLPVVIASANNLKVKLSSKIS